MKTKILLPFAALSLLTLAACSDPQAPADNGTDSAPATEVAPPAAPTPTPAPVEPAAPPAAPTAAPVSNTTSVTPEQAMQAVQAQAASMTPEQKTEAIATARKAAEDAARAQGLTDEQIKQAGDVTEASTKQLLGVQ